MHFTESERISQRIPLALFFSIFPSPSSVVSIEHSGGRASQITIVLLLPLLLLLLNVTLHNLPLLSGSTIYLFASELTAVNWLTCNGKIRVRASGGGGCRLTLTQSIQGRVPLPIRLGAVVDFTLLPVLFAACQSVVFSVASTNLLPPLLYFRFSFVSIVSIVPDSFGCCRHFCPLSSASPSAFFLRRLRVYIGTSSHTHADCDTGTSLNVQAHTQMNNQAE